MRLEDALAIKIGEVIGNEVGDRVFPDGLPEDVNLWPSVVYYRIGDEPQPYLNNCERDSTEIDTFMLEILGFDRDIVADIREALRLAFAGGNAAGRWGGESGVYVTSAFASDPVADSMPRQNVGAEELDRLERLSVRIIWERGW